MGVRVGTASLAFVLVFSGCVGPSEPSEGEPFDGSQVPTPAFPSSNPGTGPGQDADVQPRSLTLFFAPDRKLSFNKPSTMATVAEPVSFLDVGLISGSRAEFPPWEYEKPMNRTWRVVSIEFELWFSSDAPQVSWTQQAGFFKPVLTWFGEERRYSETQPFDAPTVMSAGQVYRAHGEIKVPQGGYVFEAGSKPALLLAFGYAQTEQSPILVHVGGDHASALALQAVPFDVPEKMVAKERKEVGSFPAHSLFLSGGTPVKTSYPQTLTASTAKLELEVKGASGAGHLDLDVTVRSPSNDLVWSSASPFGREIIRLFEPNLAPWGPGDYKVEVSDFDSPTGASYDLFIRTFEVRT